MNCFVDLFIDIILLKLNSPHTKESFDRCSTEGEPPLHTSRTSSRTLSCQDGLLANNMIVHVSKSAVVSCPAKKNVLHSSIITCKFKLNPFSPLFFCISLSNIPSKSFPYELLRPISTQSVRLCIISINSRSTSIFNDFISLLYLLGRNLYIHKKKKKR